MDPEGGQGKTWIQRYLFMQFPDKIQLLAPAKFMDMAYSVCVDKKIFLMNIPCTTIETFAPNIRFLEFLKDRMVFNSKYESLLC